MTPHASVCSGPKGVRLRIAAITPKSARSLLRCMRLCASVTDIPHAEKIVECEPDDELLPPPLLPGLNPELLPPPPSALCDLHTP
mmetsp:Transcript_37154/g.61536  ORF Transcript_37154/g.61536 Transcript_37154/m.61536 type:complete len:85 (+) Transcript_37154:570-824(+)